MCCRASGRRGRVLRHARKRFRGPLYWLNSARRPPLPPSITPRACPLLALRCAATTDPSLPLPRLSSLLQLDENSTQCRKLLQSTVSGSLAMKKIIHRLENLETAASAQSGLTKRNIGYNLVITRFRRTSFFCDHYFSRASIVSPGSQVQNLVGDSCRLRGRVAVCNAYALLWSLQPIQKKREGGH